jgi:hypothetical protein
VESGKVDGGKERGKADIERKLVREEIEPMFGERVRVER